jgi:HK97 family phage prohead protease
VANISPTTTRRDAPMSDAEAARIERQFRETQRRVADALARVDRFQKARDDRAIRESRETLRRAADAIACADRFEKVRLDRALAEYRATCLNIASVLVPIQLEVHRAKLRADSAAPCRVSVKRLGTPGRSGGFERKTLAFSVKASTPGASPSLTGYGAAFNNVDSVGDIIVPGAFAADLPEFLAEGFLGGLGHNWDQPVARIKSAREDSKGLLIESGPIVDTTHGVDVAKLLRAGIVRKLSIGYRAIEPRMVKDVAEVEAYWKSVNYFPTPTDRQRAREGVRLLTRVQLLEVSPVAVPANSLADITGVKSSPRLALAMSR